ncbi:MSMEG_6728 family protein [Egicoccus halophilus]|uniref:Uncharacterized protein n=1 Tax=Egicoccus halophilus TaxID=1670830 RepID=A0A8J3A9Z6_9ACTN|nr:MSMEG_6728 family protein [Egicoccus halophilus]GGI08580.1 hypothetical protein GCM10011354_29790 [Egicoccus halophilus]
MQTFLPFADFAASAAVLDDRRLGKQRVETLQILRALHLEGYGWRRHPAVTMWHGHTPALVAYGIAMVDAWVARGYADTTRALIAEFVHPDDPPDQQLLARQDRLPPWLGDEAVHRSHRSALLRKEPASYRPHFGDDPDDLDYHWPEPPAPPALPGDRVAWVVRAPLEAGRLAVPVAPGELPWTPLDARSGRITKRLRQAARLVDEIAEGDGVVVPDGDELDLAVVRGPHRVEDHRHVRPVRRVGRLARAALDFPAALQDPQVVFALHDEPAVAAALAAAGPDGATTSSPASGVG